MGVDDVFSDADVVELIEAATAGDVSRLRDLVDRGADPNATGMQGATPLMWACLQGGRSGPEALLTAGADPARCDDAGRSSVHLAAAAEDPAPLDALLEHGADPDIRNPKTGAPPLASAMMAGREQQFRRLLDAGADPHVVDNKGDTLLHVAGKINATGCILALLDAGTDATARNKQGLNFKQYLDMTPVDVLPQQARDDLVAIEAWLDQHGIVLDTPEGGRVGSPDGSNRSAGARSVPPEADASWTPGDGNGWQSQRVGSRWDVGTAELGGPWKQ